MECLINLQHSFPQDFSEPNTPATFKRELYIHSTGKNIYIYICGFEATWTINLHALFLSHKRL